MERRLFPNKTEPKTQMCKKPLGQVLARLCSWLVHRQFISQDSSWVGRHVAVGGSDSSADFPGGGAEAPTGPLRGSSCLLVSLIPCWVRQAEQRLHPVDILRGPSGRLQSAEGQAGTGVAYANFLRKFLGGRKKVHKPPPTL